MSTRSLTLGTTTYPVMLPSIRDPRLHVAAVIITIHVLGQVTLRFQVSVPQILAAILTCAVIEVAVTFRARAVLRVAGQRHADRERRGAHPPGARARPRATTGARTPGTCSPGSRRSRWRPSTSSATAARTCSTRRTSGSSSRSSCSAARGWSRSTSGGRRSTAGCSSPTRSSSSAGCSITARLRLLATAAAFWVTLGGRHRGARRVRPLHGRPLGLRAGLRLRVLAGDRHLAGGAHLPVLHDHRPEDRAVRARRPRRVRRPRGRRQHPAHGAPDDRVRHQGRRCSAVWSSSAPSVRSSTGSCPTAERPATACRADRRS